MSRVVALDVGSKRIGVATSDELRLLARPLRMIPRESYNKTSAAVAALVEEMAAARVIVGLPLALAGGETAQTERTRQFAEKLRTRLAVPVELWDETLTTVAARAILPPGRETRQTRRAGQIDAVAAAVLLQAYLDHHSAASSSLESSS